VLVGLIICDRIVTIHREGYVWSEVAFREANKTLCSPNLDTVGT
jgi:hypothetical protein